MKKIDMIVETHHMFTMKGDGVGYEEGKAVAVDKGKIVAIGTKGEIAKAYEADEVIDGSGHIVLPGLIDAHMHTNDSFLFSRIDFPFRSFLPNGVNALVLESGTLYSSGSSCNTCFCTIKFNGSKYG